MTGTEYARLQGADSCQFSGFSDAQIRYAFGDAVAVPVVTWLIKNSSQTSAYVFKERSEQ